MQEWVEAIQASNVICFEQTTKSGKSQLINLRDRLFELEVFEQKAQAFLTLRHRMQMFTLYVGSCRNDGNQLRPEQVFFMLEQVAGFQLLHIHRNLLLH